MTAPRSGLPTAAPRTDEPAPGYRRCAGILLANEAGQVFVGQRIDIPKPAWQMPQGGIDPGENPWDAARRELAEEIGTDKVHLLGETAGWLTYDFPGSFAGRVWRGRHAGQTMKWFACRFTGTDDDIDLATAHPEFRAWRWESLDRVADLIVPFKRPVYRAVIEELGPLVAPPR